ncbi:MAG TPA: dienelactone hydrolase family protein [Gemmatimonadaceae bacterium]|jgi:dienelactone hydrolase|nr:dienelactone hydrolase family protein [Gemmatimonadaceae bacterium]
MTASSKLLHLILYVGLSVGEALAQSTTADTIVVESGGLKLRALLWRPAGKGPFPAVLFNHGSGPNTGMHRPAMLGPVFATKGYVFLCLYRRGSGLSANQGSNSFDLLNRERETKGLEARNDLQLRLLDSELEEVMAGLALLRTLREVDIRRIAIAGHSFGGSLTLLAAERDSTLRAAVVFGGAARSWDGSPKLQQRLLEAVRRARPPPFFVFAANDYSVAPAKVLSAELDKLGKPHRTMIYPAVGATPAEGHAFVYSSISTWERDVFLFLAEHMR